MDELDQIPWKSLTHAYGSAEDVPDLLRALRTATAERNDDESPLYQLYGNIWHQGTVYQATSYAVPFLIELVANSRTPDRVGILGLLAAIAAAESRQWAKNAHEAVSAAFSKLLALAQEKSDVGIAAAHVLAQLPEHAEEVGSLLRKALAKESRTLYRAGLLLLCGQAGDQSQQMISVLAGALRSANSTEQFAASIAAARLKPAPIMPDAREAIMEANLVEEFQAPFEGLPWDAVGDVARDRNLLWACLDKVDREVVAETLTMAIEHGEGSDVKVTTLLELLFPLKKRGRTPQVSASHLSPLQQRAVRALALALQGKKRIFYGHFPQWGLPDTVREWRALASGCDAPEIDMTLPLLAHPNNPRRALLPGKLKAGDSVLHRHFGLGTVSGARHVDDDWIRLKVDFEEEGRKTLLLRSDGG